MVRDCRADEAGEVLELWRAAGSPPSVTDDVRYVSAAIEREGTSVLVAESGGRIVGSLIAAWDGWRGNMYRLAVAPSHRRAGIATALVQEGERRLRRLGARRLSAVVLIDEPGAAGFWERLGYAHQLEAGRFTKSLPP